MRDRIISITSLRIWRGIEVIEGLVSGLMIASGFGALPRRARLLAPLAWPFIALKFSLQDYRVHRRLFTGSFEFSFVVRGREASSRHSLCSHTIVNQDCMQDNTGM
jgi:hypothetical protein